MVKLPINTAARSGLACATPGCPYLVHSKKELGGYCCIACAEDGSHGHRCEGIIAPENARKADPNCRPLSGEELAELEAKEDQIKELQNFKDEICSFDPSLEFEDELSKRIDRAEQAKEAGNSKLKAGRLGEATAKYLEGIELTERVVAWAPTDIGIKHHQRCKVVFLALCLNCAQACLKNSNWTGTVEHADKALKIEKDNPKALYRRAVASMHFDTESRYEQARDDLVRLARLEPGNRDAREQLQRAKDCLKEIRQREKQAFSGALSGGLYQEQHEKLKARKLQFEEEMNRRREADLDTVSYEQWEKEEAEKKEAETNQAWNDSATDWDTQSSATQTLTKSSVMRSDELELDEEDEKLIKEASSKGYYHGRLNTVLSNAAPKPQRLSSEAQDELQGKSSKWNQAGTWEEKDMTTWAKDKLTSWLKQASVTRLRASLTSGESVFLSAEVKDIDSLVGDAQIVTIRHQPRHCYNFEAELSFTLFIVVDSSIPAESSPNLHGILNLQVADSIPPQQVCITSAWKSEEKLDQLQPDSNEWLEMLYDSVRMQIAGFLHRYNQL